ncbi:MAG TPA: MFS transporter [Bacilli bacterium]|nr:MFS transporter [Bacilli bacterium]
MLTEMVSAIGSSLTTFVLAYWAWKTFDRPGAIAEVTISFFLPMIITAPIAGILIDRLNRKAILIVSNLILSGLLLLLAYLMYTDHLQFWHVYTTAIVHACCTAFRTPTLQATMGLMVDRKQLTRITGLTQSLNATAFICGPLIGGLLIGFLGGSGLLVLDAGSFLVSVIGALLVAIPTPVRKPQAANKPNFLQEIAIGARFLMQHKSMVALVLSGTVFGIFGSFLVVLLLPMSSTVWTHLPEAAWMADLLGGGSNGSEQSFDAQVSGAMNTLLFFGVFTGGLLMASWGGFKNRVTNVMVGLLLAGLFQALVATPNLYTAGFALFVCGLAGPMYNSTVQTIYLNKTPPEIQGRVFSLLGLIGQITYPIGLVIVGLLGDHMKPADMLMYSGIGCVICCTLFLLFSSLRHVDRLVPNHEEAAGTTAG